jgi:hypothetical protein
MLAKRKGDSKAATRFRSDRMFCDGGSWFFYTREGSTEGPFGNEAEAAARLEAYIQVVESGMESEDEDLSLE